MTTRVSSQLARFLGAELRILNNEGKVSNVFLDTIEDFGLSEASNRLLANPEFIVDGIDPQVFFSLRDTLEVRGVNQKVSKTIAMLLIDAGKVLRRSPFELLELLDNQRINIDIKAFAALNRLRPASSQLGTLRQRNNNRSFKARSIRA